ncbi:MAG: ABC transporter permease [Campylobacteraceae bacterium]|nr:ABC transporter permease [Campylobacteraceae bacterium]NQY30479.1 ABC transporter permease [Flavobacteriaceae bacterium]
MADERLGTESLYSRILKKPEFTSVVGVLGVFLVFFMIAEDAMFTLEGVLSWTEQAALIGIIAVGACLLMIGGEFDLSVGSMIGFSGIIMAIMTVEYGIPAWISIITAFIIASGIGFLNGYIVVKTKLPSFIVTLASLFILRGLTVAISRLLTDQTLVGGVKEASEGDWLASLFGGEAFTGLFTYFAEMGMIATYDDGTPVVTGIKMLLVWWIALTVIGVVILRLTKYGNWIYATGGDEQASKNMGVPTDKVKILLFMGTAVCATIFAACQVFDYGSADAQRGLLKEFEAIIAVVMGGALLTGGYGTVIGASLGALIFGIVNIGISYTSIDSDWFRVFLGLMLLGAVMLSNSVRKKIMRS